MWAVAAQPLTGLTPMIPTPSGSGIARAGVLYPRRCRQPCRQERPDVTIIWDDCATERFPGAGLITLAYGLESDSRMSQIAEPSPLHWHQRRNRCEDQAPRQRAQRLGSPYPILHTAGPPQFNR